MRAVTADVAAFEEQRPRLFALAYRMLGSASEAEDVVQSAYLRYAAAEGVRDAAAFLTTVVTRLCLDELRSARVRREQYLGPWLPEPVESSALGPLDTVEQREQVSYAALLLLERLTAQERAVCVLREAFGHPYRDVAQVLGLTRRTAANWRGARVPGSRRADGASLPRGSRSPS